MEQFRKYFQVIASAGLMLLVFLLPLQTCWIAEQGMINGNPSGYLTLSVYGTDLLIIVLLLMDIVSCRGVQRNGKGDERLLIAIRKMKYVLLLGALLVAWSALSILWSSDKVLAALREGWLLLGMGLVLLLIRYGEKARLIFWFCAGLTVSAWLGIGQFVFQNTFASKWLGLAVHDPGAGGTSIVELYGANGSPIRWLRAYGSFDHPNVFGMVMAVGILLTIAELMRTKYGQKYNKLFYFALASMSAGLFASLSRDAWAGLALGTSIILSPLLRNLSRSKLRNKLRNSLKPILMVAVVFAIMAAIYPAQFLMRSGGSGRLEVKSIDDRATYFQQGKEMIGQRALLGTGIGNYIMTLKKTVPSNPAWTYQPVHDVPLLVWAEMGLFGILITVALFSSLWLYAWQGKNVLGLALLVSLIPPLLLDHWLWDLHFGILFLGLIVGIILNDGRNGVEINLK